MDFELQPLPYHQAVASHIEAREPELWSWFRSEDFARKYRRETDTELLRTALRLEAKGANARRYALAEEARNRLGLSDPVRLYQMHDTTGIPNAFLTFTPGEIVICFAGRILELLDADAELLDLLGHEISHYRLFVADGGRYYTADRLLFWFLMRDGCPAEFVETWRRCRLYTEIYCDLGGLKASGDRNATILGLVKSLADFKDADAESYLKQVDQLMAHGPGASRGLTHPELHVRVLAIAEAGCRPKPAFDSMIETLISGASELGVLDVLDQSALLARTRAVVDRVMGATASPPKDLVAHVTAMFPGYVRPAAPTAPLAPLAATISKSIRHYLTYLLLDLGTVGRSPDILALAASVADELGLGVAFRDTARQELRGRRTLLPALKSPAV
ncbi:MAG: M48 family metalloprotease [Hyphomicrobiaceae bacterium]